MSSAVSGHEDVDRYARCVAVSKRVRWEIDRDVFRGRELDFGKKFLPDGLSGVRELTFLSAGERRLASQIQGRTYANMFGLVERFISAKMLELEPANTGSATRPRSRRSYASPTRSSSTRSCSAGSKP